MIVSLINKNLLQQIGSHNSSYIYQLIVPHAIPCCNLLPRMNLTLLFFSLPGKEALYEPGKQAGQVKMIRESNGVMVYNWVEEGDGGRWEKVGEAMGGVDKDRGDKTTFEGKVLPSSQPPNWNSKHFRF